MSADVHKYGYASKGVSVILYRTHELARKQLFVTTDWLGGFYASTAMAGTRPAGPVAAAWAALMHIGYDGYVDLTRTAHDAALALRAGIESIDGLEVRGDPQATVMAFGARRPRRPRHLRRRRAAGCRGLVPRPAEPARLAPRHGPRRQRRHRAVLVADLRRAVKEVGTSGTRTEQRDTTYGQT